MTSTARVGFVVTAVWNCSKDSGLLASLTVTLWNVLARMVDMQRLRIRQQFGFVLIAIAFKAAGNGPIAIRQRHQTADFETFKLGARGFSDNQFVPRRLEHAAAFGSA